MNKTLLRSFVLVCALFMATSTVFGQVLQPVKWSFSAKRINDTIAELILSAKIETGWHLYSQHIPDGGPVKTSFNIKKSNKFTAIGPITEPKPIEEVDKNFNMTLKYFAKQVAFKQRVRINTAEAFSIKGDLEFMCCDDEKCLPPDVSEYEFKIAKAVNPAVFSKMPVVAEEASADTIAEVAAVVENKDTAKAAADTVTGQSNISSQEDIKKTSLLSFFFLSLLGGLVALLTPCIYPMIPMTISYFMHNSGNRSKSIANATFYGFSIMAIYVLVGTVVAVFLGEDFSNWLSTHWLPNIFFFIIFFIFAASFLGMFELTLPSWMISKTDEQADKGGFLGSFFMAFTLVLVSFSCTAPIVGSILALSTQGEVIKPIVGMLGFSLAFAIPFTLFAVFPSALKSLPKSGGWLNSVKVVLGFIELALGLKFLSVADQTYHWGILNREVYLALWITIFTLMGLYLMGRIKFSHDSEFKFLSVPRLILAIITFSFVAYLVPGMFGAPLKHLSGWLPPQTTQEFDITAMIRQGGTGTAATAANLGEAPKYADQLDLPHGLQGYFDLDQALKVSKELKKPVFVDFTGHGCVNCREMEANVWSDPKVLKRLREDYIVCALYVDDKNIELPEKEWYTSKRDNKVKKTLGAKNLDYQITKYNANAQPFYVLVDIDGKELVKPRGYNPSVEEFVKFLDAGKEEYKKRMKL